MISPKEILEKSKKQFYKVVSAEIKKQQMFPLIVRGNKDLSGTNYSELKSDLYPLYQHSKASKGKGYSVDWKEKIVNGVKQKVPSKIYFDTIEDFLYYIDGETDYQKILHAHQMLCAAFPSVTEWADNNVVFLFSESGHLADLIKVCKYFEGNPPPHNLYIRELPVAVHSKFIENHSAALRKLLDKILPESSVNPADNDFSGRYFLRKPNTYTQIRILDNALKYVIGFDEVALTLDDTAWLTWQPQSVFIIENKTCFLTFPKVTNAVAIFGEGFKSRLSQHIPWLERTNLYCWFDLDTAGFEMLSMVRSYYPKAQSFLMDKDTYELFKRFAVDLESRKRQLANLFPEEQAMYNFLQSDNKRLEQERISHFYVQEKLAGLT